MYSSILIDFRQRLPALLYFPLDPWFFDCDLEFWNYKRDRRGHKKSDRDGAGTLESIARSIRIFFNIHGDTGLGRCW